MIEASSQQEPQPGKLWDECAKAVACYVSQHMPDDGYFGVMNIRARWGLAIFSRRPDDIDKLRPYLEENGFGEVGAGHCHDGSVHARLVVIPETSDDRLDEEREEWKSRLSERLLAARLEAVDTSETDKTEEEVRDQFEASQRAIAERGIKAVAPPREPTTEQTDSTGELERFARDATKRFPCVKAGVLSWHVKGHIVLFGVEAAWNWGRPARFAELLAECIDEAIPNLEVLAHHPPVAKRPTWAILVRDREGNFDDATLRHVCYLLAWGIYRRFYGAAPEELDLWASEHSALLNAKLVDRGMWRGMSLN